MKTVREYYKYREELRAAIMADPSNEVVQDELRVVEKYIEKIEKDELEDIKTNKK